MPSSGSLENQTKANPLHLAESTAVVTTSSSPEETSTEGADDTGGAMARPAERSIAGLIGFLIVGLVML